MLERVIEHLEQLVSFDTTNPPRAIGADHPILTYARGVLTGAGFEVVIDDLESGSVNLHARRGASRTLVNCHLDTVPPDAGWVGDPLGLRVEDGRAIGLGACDIKGAAACVLAACEQTSEPAAILLSTDEEAGQSACVRTFLENRPGYEGVLVSEPTRCRGVLSHRGIFSGQVNFRGFAGHASRATNRSALHDAMRWGAAALEAAGKANASGEQWRLNIGRIQGGTKANMIASETSVLYGFRPAPGVDAQGVLRVLNESLPDGSDATWTTRFVAPALCESDASRELALSIGLEIGESVDFWTEGALFAEAGLPTVVFGPGDIGQAHAPGEWVELAQLELAARVYAGLFGSKAWSSPNPTSGAIT